jgi:hypothetical protein
MATLSAQDYVTYLARLYEGQVQHLRHHEVMRSQATNYILVASVGLLSLLAAKGIFGYGWEPTGKILVCILIVLLNGFGALMSLKHSERSQLHSATGSSYRKQISKLFEATEFEPPEAIRVAAHERHRAAHPVLLNVPLYQLWVALHALLGILSVAIVVVELTIGKP